MVADVDARTVDTASISTLAVTIYTSIDGLEISATDRQESCSD